MAFRPPLVAAPAIALVLAATTTLFGISSQAADTERCARQARFHLSELQLDPNEIDSMRLIAQIPISDRAGPEIEGMDAWVRLKSCTGWLIITMSKACYVRQSYTRGDCRVEGLPNY